MTPKKAFLFFLSSIVFGMATVRAAGLPFTDVAESAPWYDDLKHMYDAGVIYDTPDHLFHPDGLLSRDEFVGVVVWVSCYKCLYPTPDDIIRYVNNPFVDILKKNTYFYCISYAKDQKIIVWYPLDGSGKAQCQDAGSFSSIPFCPANNITRIEAAAVLLRQAGLWDEARNSVAYAKTTTLSDVTDYWYGYAQKALEVGLISKNSENKILPNEYITRKEFVQMASKIFSINMCSIKGSGNNSGNNNTTSTSNNSNTNTGTTTSGSQSGNNPPPAIIYVCDKTKTQCTPSDVLVNLPHKSETIYDFWGYVGTVSQGLRYDWVFTNVTTGNTLSATGAYLDNFDLKTAGTWVVKLVITDTLWQSSTAYQQVFVTGNSVGNTGISLQIGVTSSSTTNNNGGNLSPSVSGPNVQVGSPIDFFSKLTGGNGGYTYHWDFSDGSTSTDPNPNHIFTQPGIYPITLVVRDLSGNTSSVQITVVVNSNPDRDGDGVMDYLFPTTSGSTDNSTIDACPLVKGPKSNQGCPSVVEFKANELTQNGGNSFGISTDNLCMINKIVKSGSIEWKLQCVSCPCAYSSEFIAQIRECDIIFPSITSRDKKTLYSRWTIFQLP